MTSSNNLKKDEVADDKSIDALTSVTGEVGPFQLIAGILLGLCITSHSLAMTENKWLMKPTEFWCKRPDAYRYSYGNERTARSNDNAIGKHFSADTWSPPPG